MNVDTGFTVGGRPGRGFVQTGGRRGGAEAEGGIFIAGIRRPRAAADQARAVNQDLAGGATLVITPPTIIIILLIILRIVALD